MKPRFVIVIAAAAALLTGNLRADVYPDAVGDLGVNQGDLILDIISVQVTNTYSDIVFAINLGGNPQAVNWGKYCIGIDTNPETGDTSEFGNGWGRKITMAPRGMDFWVGCWVDGGGGAQLFAYDGVIWQQTASPSVSTTSTNVTIKVPFAFLGKAFGDTVSFDVYTTGGGQDPAIDALNNPEVTVTSWSQFYTNNNVSTYTLQTVTAVPHTVTFRVDMGVPIWEYDNAKGDGFYTNMDVVFVRGTFNNWAGSDQLYQEGGSTIFTNTITFLAEPNSTIEYKYEGFSFPGWESPYRLNGGNRSLELTDTALVAPLVCFSDRCLTDPPVIAVEFNVDMSFQREYGEFNPEAGDTLSIRGPLMGWDAPGLVLTAGADPDVFSGTTELYYYPIGTSRTYEYKAKIESMDASARNGGWENPISTSGNNRTFTLISANPQLDTAFNDETGLFSIDTVEKLDPDTAKLTFRAYAEGIYEILARSELTGTPTMIGSVTNTSKSSAEVTYTHSGLTGVGQQYYQARFTGFNKPPLP